MAVFKRIISFLLAAVLLIGAVPFNTNASEVGMTVSAEEATTPADEAVIPAEEPTVPTEEPTEPIVPTGEPAVPTEEPTVPIEEPTVPTGEPTVPTEEPTVPTEEPTVPTEEPAVPTEEPTVPTEEPTVPTEEPTVPTEEPTDPTEPEVQYFEVTISGEGGLTPDEQYAGYLNQVFYNDGISALASAAGDRLSGDESRIYNAVAPIFRKIANGERASASISVGQPVTYGGTSYPVDKKVTLTSSNFYSISGREVMNALLADLPYECYWFDKVTGMSMSGFTSGGKVVQVTLKFTVAQKYRGSSVYMANRSKTGVAKNSAANARNIVNRYANRSDIEKLTAYRDEICALVSYDHSAVSGGYFTTNINPWQLISVFDGNSSTNVVCEGYSKAFMYLCDMTNFSGNVACYTVTGNMNGGAHMWNVVTIGGKNYLVDVTNSDSGTAGQDGRLFLVGGSGSAANGYRVAGIYFVYDSDTKSIWGTGTSSILTLSGSGYVKGAQLTGAPSVKTGNDPATGKPRLTWGSMKNAVQYQVYRATSKTGKYTLMKTVTGTSYINANAQTGKIYYYKVRAVNVNGEKSKFSSIVSRRCDLPRPEVTLSSVASSGKIKVSWKAISGAKSYKVYRATSENGEYTLMKTTTSTSYTNTSAKAGQTYYYKVRAIHSNTNANSAYSLVKSRTCDLARPEITLSNVASTGNIKISWKAISGAKCYDVYYATSKDGPYSFLEQVSGTSCTDTLSTRAGQTYYYKVKAVHANADANSAFSTVKSRIRDLARPNVSIGLDYKGDPVLYWDKLDFAVKYQVYRSTSKTGSYFPVKTTSGYYFIDTSAAAGRTYYYKVKAIHESHTDANSAYSLVCSIRAE